jgi:tetratricopeptide (TPR) repeat protein
MYAAQYDQLESARLLLERGADPNAITLTPSDSCFYTLKTTSVTPLHYAVRYASRPVIELLIANGAVPHIAAEPAHEFPFDWLRRYAGKDAAEEVNVKLSSADVDTLGPLLQVPAADEFPAIAAKLTQQAEAQYAAGKVVPAYRALRQAVRADVNNTRAWAALSLVALRAGKPGESLEASGKVLAHAREPALQADAWFNTALACQVSGWIYFNGETYCERGFIKPMLAAWDIRHSAAVEKKLDEAIRSPASKACVVSGPRQTQHRYVFVVERSDEGPQVQRLYVQHPSADRIDGTTISWNVQERTIQPKQQARYDFKNYSITVFQGDKYAAYPVRVGTQTCSDPR